EVVRGGPPPAHRSTMPACRPSDARRAARAATGCSNGSATAIGCTAHDAPRRLPPRPRPAAGSRTNGRSHMLLAGRVAIVTGAGRGIGREEALLLAKHGAKVVVNDLGGSHDGSGASQSPADEVVAAIRAAGGDAIANADNVADYRAAERMVRAAIDRFGALHVVVNNAGILRDRMIFNMNEEDFDSVVSVHLKGTFNLSRHACAYWREEHKKG